MAIPTIQLTGKVLGPDGVAPTAGTITVLLSEPGTAMDGGTAQLVTGRSVWTLAADGSLPAAADLVPNDAITRPGATTAGGTFYTAHYEITTGGKKEKFEEEWVLASAPSSLDIGDVTRTPESGVVPVGVSVAALLASKLNTDGNASDTRITATGSTTARTAAEHASDRVSVKDFGAVGDGVADDTAAIQAAINSYAASSNAHGRIHFPRGRYRITSTITVKGHQILAGDIGGNFGPGEPETEIAWYGPDGGTAVITAVDDNSDWSRGGIEDLQIRNRAVGLTSGWGLKVRNPQNGAYLRNVKVQGFPTRQVLVYEPSGRGAGAGTTPGYFFIDNLFANGGMVPVEIETGSEPITVTQMLVGTDTTSTQGVLVRKNANAQAYWCPITFISSCVEMIDGTADIPGFEWANDVAITFIGCHVQRDGALPASTKAAFLYSGANPTLPNVEIINSTSWRMQYHYEFSTAVLRLNAAMALPESFAYTRNRTETVVPFIRETVTAGLAAVQMYEAGNVNAGMMGFIAHRPGTLVGISASYTGTISTSGADDLYAAAYVNGVQGPTIHLSSASTTMYGGTGKRAHIDLTVGTQIQAWLLFAAGDQIEVKLTTGAGFLPINGHLTVHVAMRFR